MRFLLLALMIALLPLRSWASDTMAAQMVAHGSTQASAHCQEPATEQVRDATNVQDAKQDHCDTCPICQVCQSVSLANATQKPVLQPLHHYAAMPSGTSFVSATAATELKPPIF